MVFALEKSPVVARFNDETDTCSFLVDNLADEYGP